MIVFVAVLGIALPSCAQMAGQISADQISVRLVIPQSSVCLGSASMHLNATLTNNSDKRIEVSPDGLYHGSLLVKYRDNKAASGGGHLAEITPSRWIRLLPHESRVVPFEQDLGPSMSQDREFFQTEGTFSIQVDFGVFLRKRTRSFTFEGTTRSNVAYFSIAKCK